MRRLFLDLVKYTLIKIDCYCSYYSRLGYSLHVISVPQTSQQLGVAYVKTSLMY